ncbi:MAG: ATP-binding protein, partial [Acutalibacteraceae bacterium]|nr:ATP-binding protein [Acutalibacteraceae bacterium]
LAERELERHIAIERSIIKKYRKTIWNNFVASVQEYDLISEGDKIAVCISGGKDSMLMAVCMRNLQRYSKVKFDLVYLVMNPGYTDANAKKIVENAEILKLPITVFKSDIFDVTERCGGAPCYLCARMRRGCLYSKAKDLGCNKIALGHHFNDVIETVLMSMMYSSEIKTMLPKLHSTNFEGMELIRPLYKVKEQDIISWSKYNGLEFLQCACKMTEKNSDLENASKRKETKQLIADILKFNPEADDNIFRSLHNVNLATIPGYRDRDSGKLYTFKEIYNKEQ